MSIQQLAKETGVDEILKNGVKKTKTPRNYDSILKGALALPLLDRCKLKKELIESIHSEVIDKKNDADEAAKIAGE